MRRWIAAFFFLLFACQALPVAALGKAIAKTQQSDTGVDGTDDEGDGTMPDAAKLKKSATGMEDFVHHCQSPAVAFTAKAVRMLFLHRADHLLVLYAGEVATPPPNVC